MCGDVMVVGDRLETSEMCCGESQSTELQPQPCVTQSTDVPAQSCALSCDNDVSKLGTSVHPVDACHTESESAVTAADSRDVEVCRCDVGHSDDTHATDSQDSTVQSTACEMNVNTLAHSDNSLFLEQECQSGTTDVFNTFSDVVDSNVEHLSDSTDLSPQSMMHENLTVDSDHERDLPPCNDSNISLDSESHDISSVKTESKPAVSDSDDTVDDTFGKYDTSALTQAESYTTNSNVHHAVTNQIKSISTCEPDSVATVTTESIVTKSGVRYVLSASVNEVSQPMEETVTHIGSTCVHVTDELSVINGVVRPVDCGVKMGEFCILCVL